MKRNCPRSTCKYLSPERHQVVQKGSFWQKSTSRWIPRYRCKLCKRTFSRATTQAAFGQNKRRLNTPILRSLASGVSMRRTALLLNINYKTVARKLHFLANQARTDREAFLTGTYGEEKCLSVQFDDMETAHHTKCKPLSITLLVDATRRYVIGNHVSVMPAKGRIAAISREKYGPRPDHRAKGLDHVLENAKKWIDPQANFLSDQATWYRSRVKKHFSESKHRQVKSRRACVAGQGELKKGGHDPLFTLNHTAAMFRANINRLFRRTWCTTKKIQSLEDHLEIYVHYYHYFLLPRGQR